MLQEGLHMSRFLAPLMVCLSAAVAQPVPTSPAELAAFRADLKATFINDDDGPGTSAGGPPMMRSLVRLGFHDCASDSCDGCIDVDAKSQNAGLDAMVDALAPLCTTHGMGMADCFAAAASMAVEETSYAGATVAYVPLFFGRGDAATCGGFTKQNPEAEFPRAQDGFEATFSYFEDTFGFSQRETVAIMGAHSLGRAETEGSGFEGAWTMDPNVMDNSFYKDMLKGTLGWEAVQTDGTNPMWQWTSTTGEQLMLNSDMVLAMDIFEGSPKDSGEPSCSYADCGPSATLAVTEEYAADNVLFMKEFTDVWIKMVTKGSDICALAVVPSGEQTGPEIDQLYGITSIQQSCGVSAIPPETVGPTTSGVLLAAPAAAPVAAGIPTEEALPPVAAASTPPPVPQDGSSSTDMFDVAVTPSAETVGVSSRDVSPTGAAEEGTAQPPAGADVPGIVSGSFESFPGSLLAPVCVAVLCGLLL